MFVTCHDIDGWTLLVLGSFPYLQDFRLWRRDCLSSSKLAEPKPTWNRDPENPMMSLWPGKHLIDLDPKCSCISTVIGCGGVGVCVSKLLDQEP